jgi:hypothetical protein
MTVQPASVPRAAVQPLSAAMSMPSVGRVLAGIVDALRAVLIYGEARRLCPSPARAGDRMKTDTAAAEGSIAADAPPRIDPQRESSLRTLDRRRNELSLGDRVPRLPAGSH